MNYKEFGEHLGKKVNPGDIVWICDYRHNDILEKPIRHVKPQQVFVFSNDDLPKNKRVYYSEVHFRPVGNKGQALKKIIAPYDNTGYRSYTGVSLNIFFTRNECIEHYKKQCEKIKDEIKDKKESVLKQFEKMEEEINKEILSV